VPTQTEYTFFYLTEKQNKKDKIKRKEIFIKNIDATQCIDKVQ
jgi:hypothetical protein